MISKILSAKIYCKIPIPQWNPKYVSDFSRIPKLDQPGLSSIYRKRTTVSKKFLPRAAHASFVEISRDSNMARVYMPFKKDVKYIRLVDFTVLKIDSIPGLYYLIYGLSMKASNEAYETSKTALNMPKHTYCSES